MPQFIMPNYSTLKEIYMEVLKRYPNTLLDNVKIEAYKALHEDEFEIWVLVSELPQPNINLEANC